MVEEGCSDMGHPCLQPIGLAIVDRMLVGNVPAYLDPVTICLWGHAGRSPSEVGGLFAGDAGRLPGGPPQKFPGLADHSIGGGFAGVGEGCAEIRSVSHPSLDRGSVRHGGIADQFGEGGAFADALDDDEDDCGCVLCGPSPSLGLGSDVPGPVEVDMCGLFLVGQG